jgi:hypothetical protein
MGGCPCRNSIMAAKRFVYVTAVFYHTKYLCFSKIHIYTLYFSVSLRIEPIKAPAKTVTFKRVQVCQMNNEASNTAVLHLSEMISKLS